MNVIEVILYLKGLQWLDDDMMMWVCFHAERECQSWAWSEK